MGQERRPRAEARRSGRGFTAGMPAAHDDYVKFFTLFHVKQARLFADAEMREHRVEDVLDIHRPDDTPQRPRGGT